ncbi:RDD family protein [Ferrimonas balearica]|uniref:RDD family protein n=1 Tax=Ferrimonas balearica TaxID=44012 RepID=UPI001C99A377|nr:RDD family protein [Ferrimonas balearica]MBY5922305.1 RDD family protein [Ferrimonas balearica]MBY5994355.1 RDD family protein [Ferrimonas balearica]
MSTRDDPKDVITPDAFHIHPHLLNRPLASPWRRGIAMLLDLMVVVMVTESGGVLFVLLVLLTWRIRKRQWKAGRWALFLLYFLLVASLVSPLIDWAKSLTDSDNTPQNLATTVATQDVPSAIKGTAALIQAELCEDAACVREKLEGLSSLDSMLNEAERQELVEELVNNVPVEQRAELRAALAQVLLSQPQPQASVPAETVTGSGLDDQQIAESVTEPAAGDGQGTEVAAEPDPIAELEAQLAREKKRRKRLAKQVEELEEVGTSPMAWVMGGLKDLGLGFGLSAFYFTVFVAWFDGQTVGKKLTRCRVRQLDGSPISLWEAFGRYGGYSAGIATGLLGFFQIFWDPNRQAIHDKISATVVEDLRPQARLTARRTAKQRNGEGVPVRAG